MIQGFVEQPFSALSLANIFCSGEELPEGLMRRVQERFPAAHLHNLYGPTEASVDVTAWSCPESFDGSLVPIGRPISNTRIYLLDERGEPVPLGAAGEIYIGGAGVSRGYLNRPELTAERFIASPFVDGDRLYKTGDLARYLPDGNIEFLGRNDHQVKIRGYRIELGEIEARLSDHPDVGEAVVLAREDEAGDKRLVAYVVAAGGAAEASPSERAGSLRAHLAALLPDYMVPAAYVVLEALPLTPNGKLDRKALPAPEGDAFTRRAYEAPQGEIEQMLAAIWSELLGVDEISRHDNFFELGGHSLLAVRASNLIQARINLIIPTRLFFEAPTVEQLFSRLLERIERDLPPTNSAQTGKTISITAES